MIDKYIIAKIGAKFGVDVRFFRDKREYFAAFDPFEMIIEIDEKMDDMNIIQSFVHELAHVQDPNCYKENPNFKEQMEAELRAEYAAKFFMEDDWIDDGNIDYIGSEIDAISAIDCIEDGEKYYRKIVERFE